MWEFSKNNKEWKCHWNHKDAIAYVAISLRFPFYFFKCKMQYSRSFYIDTVYSFPLLVCSSKNFTVFALHVSMYHFHWIVECQVLWLFHYTRQRHKCPSETIHSTILFLCSRCFCFSFWLKIHGSFVNWIFVVLRNIYSTTIDTSQSSEHQIVMWKKNSFIDKSSF